ncbi:unnamed protein product [Toxocara canis]|uniref:protein-serine/threonine phosphatase n=1 Tax=Toxocara canis TaxID=6265 RepID=A0A183U7Q4_TOXCA|nr:unnamed protein product [Toxocara canis]
MRIYSGHERTKAKRCKESYSESLLQIRRPLHDPDDNELGLDLFWSNPMLDLSGFIENSLRGFSVFFSEDTVSNLCTKLCIDLIVRAHQVCVSNQKSIVPNQNR